MLAAVEWSQGIQDAWSRVTTFVPKFIGFLIILLIGWIIAKAIAKAADRILERVGFDRASSEAASPEPWRIRNTTRLTSSARSSTTP